MKNRRGFTLVELMVTIGIIVIVAAAGTIGIVISLKRNQEKAANLSAGAQNFESAAYEQLGGMNESLDYLPPVQTKLPDPSESDPSDESEVSEASEASETSQTSQSVTTTTTATTAASSNSGSTTLHGSQYNKQAGTTISGNGQGIDSVTIHVPSGTRITGIGDASNGGRYNVIISSDGRTATVSYTNQSWATRASSLSVNNICWEGPNDVDITYDISYG